MNWDQHVRPPAPVAPVAGVEKTTQAEDFGQRLGIRVALILRRYTERVLRRESPDHRDSKDWSPKYGDPESYGSKNAASDKTEPPQPELPGHINRQA
jgi:hypothetical protein